MNQYPNTNVYINQVLLADDFINKPLNLYEMIKKGFYMSIIDNEIVIGIHNRKNYLNFGYLLKVNQEKIDQKREELSKLGRLIIMYVII